MTHSPPPQKIAKYAVESVLGSGAMGVVYRAYDEQIERTVAIKVLHEHLRQGGDGEELAARFLREARAAARCAHPNIVTIYDFGNEGVPYIVMEYVEGMELRAFLKSNADMPLASAVDITLQVLQALAHAHNKGIVHRDIKPENIILLENGALKVSDFGVARLDTSDLTGTGFMVGTPSYMSPEALQGQSVDARSDLFSVGVVLFELISRQRFDRDISLKQNWEKIKTGERITGKNLNRILRILTRALQKSAADRFQSAADFIQELQQLDELDTQATLVLIPPSHNSQATRILGTQLGDAGPWDKAGPWGREWLLSLEQSLATYVGPMAKWLVKKNLSQVDTMEELINQLTLHIPNEIERSQFKKIVEKSGITSAYPTGGGSGPVPSVSAKKPSPTDAISEVKQAALADILAFHTGPIAQRLIRRYLAQAVDLQDLINACARHIPDVNERQQFLDKAGKL